MEQGVFSPSEIVSLIMGVLVLFYALYNIRVLSDRKYSLFLLSLGCVVAGLAVTLVEEVLLPDLLNILEHAFLAAGAFLVALGCRRLTAEIRVSEEQK